QVGVRGDRYRAEEVRRVLRAEEDRGRAVHGTDHADGDGVAQREADDEREQQRDEDPQLARRAEEQELGIAEEWPEIGECADAEEDEHREELRGDARVVDHAENPAGRHEPRARDVHEDRAEPDRHEEEWLESAAAAAVEERTADGEHETVPWTAPA